MSELPVVTDKAEDLCEKCASYPPAKCELSAKSGKRGLHLVIYLAEDHLDVVVINF